MYLYMYVQLPTFDDYVLLEIDVNVQGARGLFLHLEDG